jgi:hypothetical protein
MVKRHISFVSLLGIVISLMSVQFGYSQLGLQFQYHLPSSVAGTNEVPSPEVSQMLSTGLVYTFRNKNFRLEVVPGLFYLQPRALGIGQPGQNGSGFMGGVDLRAYPMDFEGDCMCPTFSRRGDVFQKGFFVELGGGYYQMQIPFDDVDLETNQFFARIGAGLDIGIARKWTLTPGLRIQYMNQLHSWGATDRQINYRPVWFMPFIQIMTFFRD